MKFKDYFNIYDVSGNLHTGFLQSMDFTALAGDITMLNELTMAFIDAHLYNELSNSLVMKQWFSYIHYSKDNGRVEIFSQFYTDFVNALAAKLYKAEEWYKLKNTDFKSISATEIEIITHGKKQTDKEYGEAETTRAYGQDETSTEYGATTSATEYGATSGSIQYGATSIATEYGATSKETEYGATSKETEYGATNKETEYGAKTSATEYGATSKETEYGATSSATQYGATQKTIGYGATEKETEYGAKKNTKEYDKVVVSVTKDQDTHVIGPISSTNVGTTTNKLYPLGAAAFIDDTQSVVDGSNSTSQQINTDTWGDQSSSTATRTDLDKDDAHTDTVTEATHTDTEATIQHTDTTTGALHTDTTTEALHTDTTTEALHTDTTTEALHTDTTTEALHTDTTTEALHTDTTTEALHTDTTTEALHTDTTTEALHTDTTTRNARTDTETKAAKQDTETVQSYIDRKERTKHIIISPDKYFEIEKELANIGVYDLMLEAVKDTMLLCVWDNEEGWAW